jgi:carbon monoxide dehydrogenase subunit G
MDISDNVKIPAPPQVVFDALTDPGVLARCVAGAEHFRQTDTNRFSASGQIKIGPIRSHISVAITVTPLDPPHRAIVILQAHVAIGGADVHASLALADEHGHTRLSYSAAVTISGHARWLSRQRHDESAKELVRTFFDRLAAAIPPVADQPTTPARAVWSPPPSFSKPARHNRTLWLGAGAAALTTIAAAAAVLWARRSR